MQRQDGDFMAGMTRFAAALHRRILSASAALKLAHETGDDYAADVHRGDLDELLRIANANGVRSPLLASVLC
jgi:hypothetical protein